MDPVTGQIVVELVRIALSSAFTLAQMQGSNMDKETLNKLFEEEYLKVLDRNPKDLPDV